LKIKAKFQKIFNRPKLPIEEMQQHIGPDGDLLKKDTNYAYS